MADNVKGHKAGLFQKLGLPLFGLIVAVIVLLISAASYILIRIQNDHSLRMAEQSMKFAFRNIGYQFTTMNNVAAFILSNPTVDNLIDNQYENSYEAIGDYYELQTNLQNVSLLSLMHDFVPNQSVKTSYTVSLALEPVSSLYEVSPDLFSPGTGIFKADSLLGAAWYDKLKRNEDQTVWWGQTDGQQDMLYTALKKICFRHGRELGTVMIGADARSIRGVIGNAPLEQGRHLLLDESGRVIYSETHPFLENISTEPYIRELEGKSGSRLAAIGGEKHRVIYDTFDNGWRLLAIVPESHISRYTYAISAVGAAIAAAALFISGLWLRHIVIRVTVPITKLVNAVQRREVVNFEEPMPKLQSGIYEVDELNEKFLSMLVIIRGLIEKSYAEELEKRQLQLELLQAQVNPHFLYNTLDLINCRAIMSGDKDTSQLVRSLANVFRYGLNKGKAWIALEGELKQAESYLYIQQQMMKDLGFTICIQEGILNMPVVHLILQPLVENSIIHGFAQRTGQCRIEITALEDKGLLIIRVEDNGVGVDAEEMNRRLAGGSKCDETGKPIGYGTLNVHRRIVLHCGEVYGLRYIPVASGTRVEAVLPMGKGEQHVMKEG